MKTTGKIFLSTLLIATLLLTCVVTATAEPAAYMIGDADGDGEVTIFDVTFIQRFLAHMPGVVINEAAADVDGDGEVSIIDVTLIQRHLASMPVKYPIDQYV